MGTPFMSEIRIMSFNFAPKGWAQCNGQFLPINQNQALFSLLGTMYGGDGRVNFALPDLRGRTAIHQGSGFVEGQAGGQEAHTLTISEMPSHTHTLNSNLQPNPATLAVLAGNLLGVLTTPIYKQPSNLTTLQPATIGNAGGSQAHTNLQPYSVLNFCIALQGAFPSQN
jgi:microcystin-dependent protein